MKYINKIFIGISILALVLVLSNFKFSVTPNVEVSFGATNAIPTPIALFQTSLASSITSTATSMTLVAFTDKDGNTLNGTYAFIIDEGTANEEFVNADCVSSACTNMTRGLSVVTGTTSITALKHEHRRGASVKITDAPQLLILHRVINGISTFPNKISYTSHPTFSSDTELVDKKFVADTMTGLVGTATTTTYGTVKTSTATNTVTSTDDTRLPTQSENDALVGTSGTPSSSNKFVTNDDTTGTGAVQRASALASYDTLSTYTFGETITLGDTLYFKVSDSKVYKASATTTNEAFYNYVGIAAESGSANDVKKVYTKNGSVVTIPTLGATTTSIASTRVINQATAGGSAGQLYTGSQQAGTVFTATATQGNVEKIEITFAAQTGTGGGAVTLYLMEITGYTNSTTVTSTQVGTVTLASPTQNVVNTFTFASPITVKPNTQYIVLLEAAGGSGANYWTISAANTAIAGYMTTTSATAIASGTGSPFSVNGIFVMGIYSTLQSNYDIGDYIYLGDTAGSYSITGGTTKLVVGQILSATTVSLGVPAQRKLIKTIAIPTGSNSYSNFATIPIPRNTIEIDFTITGDVSGAATLESNFNFKIGQLGTKRQSVGDTSGATGKYWQAVASFGKSGTILPSGSIGTLTSQTSVAYFYK